MVTFPRWFRRDRPELFCGQRFRAVDLRCRGGRDHGGCKFYRTCNVVTVGLVIASAFIVSYCNQISYLNRLVSPTRVNPVINAQFIIVGDLTEEQKILNSIGKIAMVFRIRDVVASIRISDYWAGFSAVRWFSSRQQWTIKKVHPSCRIEKIRERTPVNEDESKVGIDIFSVSIPGVLDKYRYPYSIGLKNGTRRKWLNGNDCALGLRGGQSLINGGQRNAVGVHFAFLRFDKGIPGSLRAQACSVRRFDGYIGLLFHLVQLPLHDAPLLTGIRCINYREDSNHYGSRSLYPISDGGLCEEFTPESKWRGWICMCLRHLRLLLRFFLCFVLELLRAELSWSRWILLEVHYRECADCSVVRSHLAWDRNYLPFGLGFLPAALGLPTRGDSTRDFFTSASSRVFEKESNLVMPALKLANSGVDSKRSLLNGGACASPGPVVFGLRPSAMLSHLFFPSQLSIRQAASDNLLHADHEAMEIVRCSRLLNRNACSSTYLKRWNGSTATYVPCNPRFNNDQKFSIPFVWT